MKQDGTECIGLSDNFVMTSDGLAVNQKRIMTEAMEPTFKKSAGATSVLFERLFLTSNSL
jgi:hypothetical protein